MLGVVSIISRLLKSKYVLRIPIHIFVDTQLMF